MGTTEEPEGLSDGDGDGDAVLDGYFALGEDGELEGAHQVFVLHYRPVVP